MKLLEMRNAHKNKQQAVTHSMAVLGGVLAVLPRFSKTAKSGLYRPLEINYLSAELDESASDSMTAQAVVQISLNKRDQALCLLFDDFPPKSLVRFDAQKREFKVLDATDAQDNWDKAEPIAPCLYVVNEQGEYTYAALVWYTDLLTPYGMVCTKVWCQIDLDNARVCPSEDGNIPVRCLPSGKVAVLSYAPDIQLAVYWPEEFKHTLFARMFLCEVDTFVIKKKEEETEK